MKPLDLQREVRRPRDLLFQRELGVQPEPLVLRVQIDPLAELPDDVVAPLGGAEDEVRCRHGKNDAGRRPVVGVNLRRAAEESRTSQRGGTRRRAAAKERECTHQRGEDEVEGGGEGVVEHCGEALAGGEVQNLHPAVAGVALVPRALPQRHLHQTCVNGASPPCDAGRRLPPAAGAAGEGGKRALCG